MEMDIRQKFNESLKPLQQPQTSLRTYSNNTLEHGNSEVSIFAAQPPATAQQIKGFVEQLSIRYPHLPIPFWTAVADDVARQGFSYERLTYMFNNIINGKKIYDISDVLSIDKKVKILSYREYYKQFGTTEVVAGYCKLKQRTPDGYVQYCLQADAMAAGLEIEE